MNAESARQLFTIFVGIDYSELGSIQRVSAEHPGRQSETQGTLLCVAIARVRPLRAGC